MFEGLELGGQPLEARATGFALWSSTVSIEAEHTTTLRIELDPGAALEGIVRDEHGAPVAGALVRGFASAVDPTFVAMGQFDDPNSFGSPITRSDADGHYHLAPVWTGEVHAYASPPPKGDHHLRVELHAEEVLHPKTGETLVWNPVLSPGHAIRGRIMFSDGEPMKGFFVNAIPAAKEPRRVVYTDEHGTFEFFNLPMEAFRIDVQLWKAPPDGKPLAREDVWPDQGDVLLTAAFENPDKGGQGQVTGLVLDARGEPPLGIGLGLSTQGGIIYRVDHDEDGRFRSTDLPKGEYSLLVSHGGDTLLVGERFQLAAGEKRDLGTLRLPPPASLTLRIERASRDVGADARLFLRRENSPDGRYVPLTQPSPITIDGLTLGRYEVNWWGKGLANGKQTVDLERTQEAVVKLIPGVARRLLVSFPGTGAGKELCVRVADQAGEVVYDLKLVRDWSKENPYEVELMLPLGTFAASARTDAGLEAKAELVVHDLAADAAPTKLELH